MICSKTMSMMGAPSVDCSGTKQNKEYLPSVPMELYDCSADTVSMHAMGVSLAPELSVNDNANIDAVKVDGDAELCSLVMRRRIQASDDALREVVVAQRLENVICEVATL
jgi:hypothetical protein